MSDVDDEVIAEVADRSQNLLFGELVALIERAHPDAPGISRETFETYAHELGDAQAVPSTADELLSTLDDQLTDTNSWVGKEVLYAFDDRISVYPARWHDELGGNTDIPSYIQFIEDETSGDNTDVTSVDPGDGIPEEDLIDVVAIVGRTDKETVKSQLEQLRDQGDITEGADQHPNARVYLPDRTDRRDPTLQE